MAPMLKFQVVFGYNLSIYEGNTASIIESFASVTWSVLAPVVRQEAQKYWVNHHVCL